MAWHKSLWESHQNKCQKMARNGTSHFSLLHTICCRMINTGGRQLTSHEIKHSPNGMAMTMDIRFIKTSTKEWMCDRKEYNPRGNVLKLPCANMRFDFFYTCCCGQMGIIFTENIIRMKCQPKNVHSRGLLFFSIKAQGLEANWSILDALLADKWANCYARGICYNYLYSIAVF